VLPWLIHYEESWRQRCTKAIAMPPSPTDAATRFTDPERMSPTAKIPVALVSKANGSRSPFHTPLHRIGSRQDEAVLVAPDLRGQPASRRFGADEDEERPRLPSRCRAGPSIDDLDRLELFISVHRHNLGSCFDPDVGFGRDLLDEIRRHAFCE